MAHLFLIATLACLFSPTNQILPSQVVLMDMASFLGIDGSMEKEILSQEALHRNEFKCIREEKAPLAASNSFIDTKDEDCGWEPASVTVVCAVFGISGVGLTLRNVLDPKLSKNVNPQLRFRSRTLQIPSGEYITAIEMGYAQSFITMQLTSLVFNLSNGSKLTFTCSRPQHVSTVRFGPYERTTGFYGSLSFGVIANLTFYKSRVVQDTDKLAVKSGTKLSYTEVLKKIDNQSKTLAVKDRFEKVGLTGPRIGGFFEDPYLYGHWKLTQIRYGLTKRGLSALQSTIENTFFNQVMSTEIHGSNTTPNTDWKSANVPINSDIRAVELVTTADAKIAGIRLYYTDGTDSGYLGETSFKPGTRSKFIEIKGNTELMGFFGWDDGNSINALGLLLVGKNASKRFYDSFQPGN